MTPFQDAFISYGRADSKQFAQQLNNRLIEYGKRIWFDFDDIPLGVDYQKQIDDGIEKADNFLFIISPHAVNSPYCGLEIELALKLGKRIIPLLHVEEISRDTWQQRNPDGTEKQWTHYQSEGKHSSFPNMHPDISKINWVYCREGIDDSEQAVQGVLELLARQQDYVHQHTVFLEKALAWERNHKQSHHLLIGEERQQADAWLRLKFKDEQPPVRVTDLQCEFITESIKQANNWMSQVFLIYAQTDKAIMEKIRLSLWREGITVWTNITDIPTGDRFEQAIRNGIEKADNLIYLLSPEAVRSDYCEMEVRYGRSLNKRIIPILVRETDDQATPDVLRDLQYVDLTDNVREEDYALDESQLLQTLHRDATYYYEHKVLLVKALKWSQYRNPSMLLRGYNLRTAEAWLKTATHHARNPHTSLHLEFIEESLRLPPAPSLDVFISYSRDDAEFARTLNDALQIQGKTTWFDQESIAAGSANFETEIRRGIAASDHFLFILSPRAVNSPYCASEVEYAARLHKRFLTLLYQPINSQDLHPSLAKVQWIDCIPKNHSFEESFRHIIRVLDTDPDHVRNHTKWLQRALAWEQKHQNPDMLLRGSEFTIAENWLQEAEQFKKRPTATPLLRDYIMVSRASVEAAIKRERFQARLIKGLLGTVSFALLTTIFLGVRMFQQKQLVERSLQSQTLALSQSSRVLVDSSFSFDALLNAMQAAHPVLTEQVQLPPALYQQVEASLQMALHTVQERNQLERHTASIFGINVSPDGNRIATASGDKTVKLWSLNGEEIRELKGHGDWVYDVTFSPNGEAIATASKDKTAKLWSLDGTVLATFLGHTAPVYAVRISPDGQQIATASFDGTVRLWDRTGQERAILNGHQGWVYGVSFSPDGQFLASAGIDQTVRIWTLEGTLLQTFTDEQNSLLSVSFSPDGQTLAAGGNANRIKLWNLQEGSTQTLSGHGDNVWSVRFSPDGKTLVSTSGDRTVKVWHRSTLTAPFQLQTTLTGHLNQVYDASFSPDGQWLVTASQDDSAKVWQLDGTNKRRLEGHQAGVRGVSFSADGQWIATASEDKTAKIWRRNGQESQTLDGHQDWVYAARFSPDGQIIATASKDGTVNLWTLEGELIQTLTGHQGAIYAVDFSPDGQMLVTGSGDRTAKLWTLTGEELSTLEGHQDDIYAVDFSPDGETIVTTGADGTIRLWTLDGQEKHQFSDLSSLVYSVVFSPDGQSLLTASRNTLVRQWTLDGTPMKKWTGHQNQTISAQFSADGHTIASASFDGTAKRWTIDGQELLTVDGHTGAILNVAFSPDGGKFATAGSDGVVILWEINPLQTLMDQGCAWLNDYLQTNPNVSKADRTLC